MIEYLGSQIGADYPVTNFWHFVDDMKFLCRIITDGPLKSYCFKRLAYLSHKFQLHVLLNDLQELKAQKQVPHRDFYNVRKVVSLVSRMICDWHHNLTNIGHSYWPTGHSRACRIMHEPKAFVAIHQEDYQNKKRR